MEKVVIYSNSARISSNPFDMTITFSQIVAEFNENEVTGHKTTELVDVITTPKHAKLLLHALATQIAKYEDQYGEISTDKIDKK
jgi:hypothetical protein